MDVRGCSQLSQNIALALMTEQDKITLHMQLNNICNLVNGTWKHTTIVHSNGKREEKFVISYPSLMLLGVIEQLLV